MFAAILPTVLAAFVPAGIDAIRGVIGKFFGTAGAQPQNVDEQIKLMDAETRKLEALAKLDMPMGEVSRWVADLRGATRYVMGILVLVVTLFVAASAPENKALPMLAQLCSSVIFFFLGDRVYLHMTGKAK